MRSWQERFGGEKKPRMMMAKGRMWAPGVEEDPEARESRPARGAGGPPHLAIKIFIHQTKPRRQQAAAGLQVRLVVSPGLQVLPALQARPQQSILMVNFEGQEEGRCPKG